VFCWIFCCLLLYNYQRKTDRIVANCILLLSNRIPGSAMYCRCDCASWTSELGNSPASGMISPSSWWYAQLSCRATSVLVVAIAAAVVIEWEDGHSCQGYYGRRDHIIAIIIQKSTETKFTIDMPPNTGACRLIKHLQGLCSRCLYFVCVALIVYRSR